MAGKAVSFYVYRIFDGHETVYIGKGSGTRLQDQKRRFGCDGEIIETCKSDDHAFERERYWIKTLMPTANISPGGNGGRVKPRRKTRVYIDSVEREIEKVGSRRYCARLILSKVNEQVKIRLGLSNLDLNRLREVANGPRC